jgi:predicted permease
MQALADVILPVFLVIVAGYLMAWRGHIGEGGIDGLMRFAQGFALPLLLFRSVAALDLSRAFDAGLLLSFYVGAFSGFAAGFAGARLLFSRPTTDAVAIGFACLFSNSLLLGVPITERAYGAQALTGNFAIISIHAPLFYAFGITAMELARAHGLALPVATLSRQIVTAIAVQPLVIGIAAGFAVNLTGLPLPRIAAAAVDLVVAAGIPTALFGLGGVLYRYRPEGDAATVAMICAVGLMLHPAVTWLLATQVFGLDRDALRSAVVTAAMAPGVNAYLFAHLYGVARRVAATAVLAGTALSIPTVWFWLHVLP